MEGEKREQRGGIMKVSDEEERREVDRGER